MHLMSLYRKYRPRNSARCFKTCDEGKKGIFFLSIQNHFGISIYFHHCLTFTINNMQIIPQNNFQMPITAPSDAFMGNVWTTKAR